MNAKRLSRPPGKRRGHRGVAMLEVLVSLLLFSLGLLGMIGLQARALSISTDAEDRNRAALLANDIASAMWLNRSVTVDTSEGSPWQTRVADQSQGGVPNGELKVTAVAGTTNSADILITWKATTRKDDETSSSLSTRVTLP